MKGLALRFVILLALAVIVIAIALNPLQYVFGFELFNLSPDQEILVDYSTCALALCAAGIDLDGTPSSEVNSVGCLKHEGGECVLSCAQVPEKVYGKDVEFEIVDGRQVYCGKGAKIDFQFTGLSFTGGVPLTSGEMRKLTKSPKWICEPFGIEIGGRTIYLDNILTLAPGSPDTVDIQYDKELEFLRGGPKDCIMKADLFVTGSIYAEVVSDAILELIEENENINTGGGCFAGIIYDEADGYSSLFTPIYEYETEQQKIHPSAIYLKAGEFTQPLRGSSEPECTLQTPQRQTITDDQIKEVAELYKDRTFCKGRALDVEVCDTEDVKWDDLEIQEQERFALLILKQEFDELIISTSGRSCPAGHRCNQFEAIEKPANPFGNPITKCNFKSFHNGDKITYSVYADSTLPSLFGLFGSCKTVTLERDLGEPAKTTVETETEEEQEEKIIITISIDKTEYGADERVMVSGTVEGDSGGRRFGSDKVQVSYLNTRLDVVSPERLAVVDESFETDSYKISENLQQGTVFQVFAEYKDVKSNVVEFVVKQS